MSYLFLAVPNFCGSTLLHSLLETCPSVTPLTWESRHYKDNDFVEGNVVAHRGYRNFSMGPHSIEANMEHVHSNPRNYNWDYIKMVWEENWANNNPYAEIKMQKTPADIFRVQMIHPRFHDLKWIVSVRNPYAYVESLFRKATWGMDPMLQLDQICYHVTRVMEVQKENAEYLGDAAYVMTYEDFIRRKKHHRKKMAAWLPGLEYMDFTSQELMVKGKKVSKIKDDSVSKLNKFVKWDPTIITKINEYFEPKQDILAHWGYELINR